MSTEITVVYYSATGNVAALARALAEGAESAGAAVRVRRVAETAPSEAVAQNPSWQAFSAVDELATPLVSLADLEEADGIALGSPTRFGMPAAQLKSFLDTTGGLWAQGKLVEKVGTSFTSVSTAHGGVESTLLAINNTFYHWGTLVMPLGYGDPHVRKVSGNPYGASFVSRSGAAPDETAQLAARAQGRRLAQVASWVRAGRTAAGTS
jgi:NAD(P)H dehydrogenase (quinone)